LGVELAIGHHDDLVNSFNGRNSVQYVIQHGPPGDRQKRLGTIQCQRIQAGGIPRSQSKNIP
jgi:hypothetical protein